jgi:hypothetical protein
MIVWFFPIHLAAFIVAAVNSGRCPRCFSGRSGSDKPFKIARYVIYDDAIMAVGISTNDNDINNNYNNNMIKARVRIEREVGDEWTWGRDCKQQCLTDGRCVLFKMLVVAVAAAMF